VPLPSGSIGFIPASGMIGCYQPQRSPNFHHPCRPENRPTALYIQADHDAQRKVVALI